MFSIHTATRYLLYHRWADVRKSFDGLSGIVTNELKLPLQLGDVFIFLNKRQTHIKLLQLCNWLHNCNYGNNKIM